jgi:hypothetical protein
MSNQSCLDHLPLGTPELVRTLDEYPIGTHFSGRRVNQAQSPFKPYFTPRLVEAREIVLQPRELSRCQLPDQRVTRPAVFLIMIPPESLVAFALQS